MYREERKGVREAESEREGRGEGGRRSVHVKEGEEGEGRRERQKQTEGDRLDQGVVQLCPPVWASNGVQS